MKLKYKINTILKYNKEFEKFNNNEIKAIILGNKCLCIYNLNNCFVFNKIFRLIQIIKLNHDPYYRVEKNIIPISNYPNLFAIIENFKVNIYEVQLNKKKKVILKRRIDTPKKYIGQKFDIFSLSCADILYFFQDNFFIYNIKYENFTYKKFNMPIEKRNESFKFKQIIKIIEYKDNHVIILLRDIIYGKEDDSYNCNLNIINSVVLYDLGNSELKKIFITNEDSGESNTYLGSYYFRDTTFSEDQNIFIINKSIVYIKDFSGDYESYKGYSVYIINILNGDIKYKFEDNSIQAKCGEFYPYLYTYQKSIYLCDNIFLFNGYELKINKNGIKENKIDLLYGTNEDDYKNNQHYYIKLKKNLLLLYNTKEIKICHFSKI